MKLRSRNVDNGLEKLGLLDDEKFDKLYQQGRKSTLNGYFESAIVKFSQCIELINKKLKFLRSSA